MKILINSEITRSKSNDLTWSDEELEAEQERLNDASSVLDRFNVTHTLTNDMSHWHISIDAQKICLDEVSMNTLFANGFSEFDIPLSFKYAALGGTGCELTLKYGGKV